MLCSWGRTSRVFIYGGMRDRSMRSGTKLAREIQLTDWSTAGNLSNRSSGVQIPRDICTRFGRYLYSTRCSWIIKLVTERSVDWEPSSLKSCLFLCICLSDYYIMRSRDGTVMRALASHQCVLGLIPGPSDLYGLSLLLVLFLAPRGFSSCNPVFPSPQKPPFPNSNSIRTTVKHFIMSLWLGWWCKHSLCVTLRWLNTVFDTSVSITFSSKTLYPLVAKIGTKQVNNINFNFLIIKLTYVPLPWQQD